MFYKLWETEREGRRAKTEQIDPWIWERNFLEGWDSRPVLTLPAASWGKPTCSMIPRTHLQSLELERDRVLTTLPELWVESCPQPGLVQDFHVSDTTKRILNNRETGRGMTVPQRYSGQDFEPPVSFCGGETSSRERQSSSREEIVGDWETALGGPHPPWSISPTFLPLLPPWFYPKESKNHGDDLEVG